MSLLPYLPRRANDRTSRAERDSTPKQHRSVAPRCHRHHHHRRELGLPDVAQPNCLCWSPRFAVRNIPLRNDRLDDGQRERGWTASVFRTPTSPGAACCSSPVHEGASRCAFMLAREPCRARIGAARLLQRRDDRVFFFSFFFIFFSHYLCLSWHRGRLDSHPTRFAYCWGIVDVMISFWKRRRDIGSGRCSR